MQRAQAGVFSSPTVSWKARQKMEVQMHKYTVGQKVRLAKTLSGKLATGDYAGTQGQVTFIAALIPWKPAHRTPHYRLELTCSAKPNGITAAEYCLQPIDDGCTEFLAGLARGKELA